MLHVFPAFSLIKTKINGQALRFYYRDIQRLIRPGIHLSNDYKTQIGGISDRACNYGIYS